MIYDSQGVSTTLLLVLSIFRVYMYGGIDLINLPIAFNDPPYTRV